MVADRTTTRDHVTLQLFLDAGDFKARGRTDYRSSVALVDADVRLLRPTDVGVTGSTVLLTGRQLCKPEFNAWCDDGRMRELKNLSKSQLYVKFSGRRVFFFEENDPMESNDRFNDDEVHHEGRFHGISLGHEVNMDELPMCHLQDGADAWERSSENVPMEPDENFTDDELTMGPLAVGPKPTVDSSGLGGGDGPGVQGERTNKGGPRATDKDEHAYLHLLL